MPLSIPSKTHAFTEKQGQYLAFIHTYVQLHGRAPAEADMEKFFGVTPCCRADWLMAGRPGWMMAINQRAPARSAA